MNKEIDINLNRSTEYDALRAEIRYSDRLCVTILISLYTISGTFYTVFLKSNTDLILILPLLSCIWVIGFYYITDKRFVILKIAKYLREAVESKKANLYWENWLFDKRSSDSSKFKPEEFPKSCPYQIEIFSAITIVSINLIISLICLCNAVCKMPFNSSNYDRNLYFSLSIFSGLIVAIIVYKSISYYMKYRMAMKSKNSDNE